jgi:4-diphosphocytidyl-2-C-methyl-D-erythritol kinase
MVVFPGCKINLGLHILNKREDGFHNLETIFYPLPLREALEVIRNEDPVAADPVEFTFSGNAVDGNTADNLCVKVYHLLKKDFPELLPVKMHLHKALPMGAGLGGGSADAAFTLKLLNEKFKLHLTQEQLLNYCLQLGSDCPFFLLNKPCFATGRGEILEPLDLSLSAYQIILINPGIHINTGWAFSQLSMPVLSDKTSQNKTSLKEIIFQPIKTWKEIMVNDFEKPVFKKYPSLSDIKEKLYTQGALYAAMSGSGSSIFGLFEKTMIADLDFPEHFYVKKLLL